MLGNNQKSRDLSGVIEALAGALAQPFRVQEVQRNIALPGQEGDENEEITAQGAAGRHRP
ncbi:MAG: hypothetical protein HC861_06810 [Rhodospirillaceae bacterium]|nr:hypothetical protein [Rhodospirillaceae bacterium]